MTLKITCFHCQNTWDFIPPLNRREECPNCQRECKICLNCKFHDSSAHHECREVQAEWVPDKEVGTYCSYFKPKNSSDKSSIETKKDIEDKLSQLFKNDSELNEPSPKNKSLEDLFKK